MSFAITATMQIARVVGSAAFVCLWACAADATSSAAALGVHHLAGEVDSTNLELREDDTFRWSLMGCDTFGGASGRVLHETPSILTLVPEPGQASFSWPSNFTVSARERVLLQVSKDQLTETNDSGATGQSWSPGGVCAICGPFGPTGQKPCADPFR